MSPPAGHNKEPLEPAGDHIDRRLNDLQAQTQLIRESWQAGEMVQLRILASQLTSLAEGAGHAGIGESAADLEAVLFAEEAEASAICEKIEALILHCKQASSATK
ncbi:MAG: hypothetical protein IH889_03210 [Planctomycetes bacterium]|nr:hypothetical protein [Planctomycetota bacterium]